MAVDCGLLTDLDHIELLFSRLATIPDGFGFDIETGYDGPAMEKYALHPETAFIAGMSFSGDPSWARYVPLRHLRGPNVDASRFARLLARLLGSGMGIAHHAKFELRHIAKFFRKHLTPEEMTEFGLEPDGYFPIFTDSMIEAFLMGRFKGHGLKDLTNVVFGHRMTEIDELFDFKSEKAKKAMRFSDLDLTPQVIEYACEDAAWCLALSRKHKGEVDQKLLYRVEMALVPVLSHMEDYGVLFDFAAMRRASMRVENFAAAYRSEIMRDLTAALGKTVDMNLGSPQQVYDVLYTQLGLRTTRMTKNSGKMSTDAKALGGLAKKNPIVAKIVNWRELVKLNGSYLVKYERDFGYAADGRCHASHAQTQIVSGRFAVTEPAYQQLPKKYHYKLEDTVAEDGSVVPGREFNLKFRDFVISSPDHYLIGFDYSQIELRVLAGLSGEPALVKAYNDGVDVHQLTASLMFEVPMDEVTDELRSFGKTQNFALMYGQGAKGVAERTGISVEQAKQFIERYFSVYASVKSWVSRQTESGVKTGFTHSKFGRIHPIWELESESRAQRATGERLCVNAPVQGAAADICKIAMVRVARALAAAGMTDRIHLTMNIHDALVFEVHKSVSPQRVIDLVHPEVCVVVPGWPPIEAEWEVGQRWGSMLKLKLDKNHQIVVPDRPAEPAPAPVLAAVS